MNGLTRNDESLMAAAKTAAELKDWSQAADLLAAADETYETLDKRCFYLSRAKRYEEALATLESLRKLAPDHFMPLYMTGYQYYEQGRYSEALVWFDRALARNPNHLKLLWRRAYALAAVGRKSEALASAASVVAKYRALPDVQKATERVPFAKACHMLGRSELERRGPYAIEFLIQAVEAAPSEPYNHYLLAKALRKAGEPAEALVRLRSARELKRGDIHIELEMAASLLQMRDSEGCAAALARVESRCRGWLAFKGGRLALEAGRPDLAVRLLERATCDRDTKNQPLVLTALADAHTAARRLAPPEPNSVTAPHPPINHGTGRVDMVSPERGFGFLVDASGTRRHFRLGNSIDLRRGDTVRFKPMEAEKGPAAWDVARA